MLYQCSLDYTSQQGQFNLTACDSLWKFTIIDNKIHYLYHDTSVGITINHII